MTVLEEYRLHIRLLEQEQRLKAIQVELETLRKTAKKNGESLTYAQTWVVLIIIGLIGYVLFKGVREFYSQLQKVDEEKSLRDEVDYLYNEIQILMSMCVKQEENELEDIVFPKQEVDRDPIGLSLSPTEKSGQLEKKKRKRKAKTREKGKLTN